MSGADNTGGGFEITTEGGQTIETEGGQGLLTDGLSGNYFPPFSFPIMPQFAMDGLVNNYGVRLGWMKQHTCPCTFGGQIPGSPVASCLTCYGRGMYWEPPVAFTGLITYMHTSSAPDEPGFGTDLINGPILRAEPTLTIPYGPNNLIWQQASDFDVYIEYDATTRFNTTLVVGGNGALPYPYGVSVNGVTVWDPTTKTTLQVPRNALLTTENGFVITTESGIALQVNATTTVSYSVVGTRVLVQGLPDGTAYTVEYTTQPTYVAYRNAGGKPHIRPFGVGTGAIPRRFHIQALDVFLRSRFQGDIPTPIIQPAA